MKSKSVWGNFETSRWELQPKSTTPPKNTLADELIVSQEVKKPAKMEAVEKAVENSGKVNDIFGISPIAEKYKILKMAVQDYLDDEISRKELKEVFTAL